MLPSRFAAACALLALCACGLRPTAAAPDAALSSHATLAAYRSEAELATALERWRSEAAKRRDLSRRELSAGMVMNAAPAAPAALAKSADAAGAAKEAESITNVQTAGVDEGGIVKRAGDHLVILRRGRLFTVRVGDDALQPVAMQDAYAPGTNPQGAWYDELLIAGSTVVVIGYSYARGGTEVGLFELGPDGALAYRATYHLRSFDYYSARNYASRLIGRKLIFYTPTVLQPWGPPPAQVWPGVRRWQPQASPSEFERILPATRVYRTDDDFDPGQPLALHTVTSCELGAAAMTCESSAVLGAPGRVFYVSQGSVYVWTSAWRGRGYGASHPSPAAPNPLSALFRLPLDGSAPSMLKTAGVPTDQMSFLEDSTRHLNVLVRETGAGEGMWGSDAGSGRFALLRVPLREFGDGRRAAQREHYRVLPSLAGWGVQNRFVGDWLLWGGAATGAGHAPDVSPMPPGARAAPAAWALRYADSAEAVPLHVGHAVERIEAMGADAVLVGNAGADLHFSAVRLGSRGAALAGSHQQRGARQGETRTHGFFYRPTSAEDGLLGLPVLGQPGRRGGVYAGAQGSASVVYLRQRGLAFTALGELHAHAGATRDDACKASCVDWYGNARPIFLGERIFALLGYELVEAQLARQAWGERLEERRRVVFAPNVAPRDERYSPFN